jgi:putative membrane protein
MRSTIACLAALTFAVACSKGSESQADSAGGGIGATTTPAAAPLPAPPPSTVMTDANIVAKLGGADSAEVKLAKLAQTKATNAGVKSFARLLVTDHTNHAKQLAALEQKAGITPLPLPSDNSKQESQEEFDRFQSMPKGATFDTAFVNHEVADHQKELSEVQSLQPQNAELKSLIDKTVPALQKHLDRAQALQKQLSGGT